NQKIHNDYGVGRKYGVVRLIGKISQAGINLGLCDDVLEQIGIAPKIVGQKHHPDREKRHKGQQPVTVIPRYMEENRHENKQDKQHAPKVVKRRHTYPERCVENLLLSCFWRM